MTPVSSWGLADRWATEPGARGGLETFRQLLILPLFPLSAAAIVGGLSWVSWVVLVAAVTLCVYLVSSVVMYRSMVVGEPPPDQAVEGPLVDGDRLGDAAREFGGGIGIDPGAWRLTIDGSGRSAVAPMPDAGAHSLVLIDEMHSNGLILFGFVGRQRSGRLVVTNFMRPLFPFKDADWFFDTVAPASGLWRSHCELVDQDSVVTFEEYYQWVPTENMAKQAGLWRLLRTWGRTCFQKRGLVSGF